MNKKLGVLIPALVAAVGWGAISSARAEEPRTQGKETGLSAGTVKWISCGAPEFPGV